MTTPNTTRYQGKMADIRQLLTLFTTEADYAEDWKTREGIPDGGRSYTVSAFRT